MLHHDTKKSHIVIASDIEAEYESITNSLKPSRVVGFLVDEFKVEDAKAVIAEAYVSESNVKYLLLASNNFNTISQNALLKLLEEPPKNIQLILVAPTKSNLLPTVRSRLPVIVKEMNHDILEIKMSLFKIDYSEVFTFLKEHSRIKKSEAKKLVEALFYRATVVDKLILNEKQLENFEMAYKLLELNSRPQSVFAMLLMGFVKER